eukprot:7385218-Prymnesium_polylepis.1
MIDDVGAIRLQQERVHALIVHKATGKFISRLIGRLALSKGKLVTGHRQVREPACALALLAKELMWPLHSSACTALERRGAQQRGLLDAQVSSQVLSYVAPARELLLKRRV